MKEPAPVVVANPNPIEVSVAEPADTDAQAKARVVASQGRADESDRVSHGQRRINLIWELTQAVIALSVSLTTLFVSAALVLRGEGDTAFVLLASLANLVIGFYFGRTNHQRTGGVGADQSSGR